MIEFAIVLCIKQAHYTDENHSTKETESLLNAANGPLVDGETYSSKRMNLEAQNKVNNDELLLFQLKRDSTTQKIDFAAFILFMTLFIIFNSVYFAHYM